MKDRAGTTLWKPTPVQGNAGIGKRGGEANARTVAVPMPYAALRNHRSQAIPASIHLQDITRIPQSDSPHFCLRFAHAAGWLAQNPEPIGCDNDDSRRCTLQTRI